MLVPPKSEDEQLMTAGLADMTAAELAKVIPEQLWCLAAVVDGGTTKEPRWVTYPMAKAI